MPYLSTGHGLANAYVGESRDQYDTSSLSRTSSEFSSPWSANAFTTYTPTSNTNTRQPYMPHGPHTLEHCRAWHRTRSRMPDAARSAQSAPGRRLLAVDFAV
eukprot:2894450-Rhodomonas_salina.3